MDVSIDDVVYLLTIPAGALSRDGSTMYFIEVDEDGELLEKHWNGNEITGQYSISEGVKESSSAKYLLNDDVRRVFFPSAENVLQCYEYDESEEDWNLVDLQTAEESLIIHPDSKISGCFNGNDQLIFFQDASGRLQGLRIAQSGECSSLPLFENTPETPFIHTAYEADDDSIHVLYLDDSNTIHDMKLDANTEWQDTIVEGEGFGNHQVLSFIKTATDDEGTSGFLAISTNNLVLYINQQGERIDLGSFNRKRFASATSEECAPELYTQTKNLVRALSGKPKK
ncbi:hypothetical protein BO78DRAFT_98736 [Aspergillus sclerotiicarbonarius CBS 121057]|uniref:Fucose-specific lectin n=1 Tax=Aspergillus sclerotiicarbonarius (strain CBS 121057 / IBT 28362) TaxID=1448318 RepID=A0A319EV47_ASPSB|nr:hypothetical protein BO78DRAFT_98736 [Aspergillus sclerotiicarbonarius CBS 121057]